MTSNPSCRLEYSSETFWTGSTVTHGDALFMLTFSGNPHQNNNFSINTSQFTHFGFTTVPCIASCNALHRGGWWYTRSTCGTLLAALLFLEAVQYLRHVASNISDIATPIFCHRKGYTYGRTFYYDVCGARFRLKTVDDFRWTYFENENRTSNN
jgi:hypothetical protein